MAGFDPTTKLSPNVASVAKPIVPGAAPEGRPLAWCLYTGPSNTELGIEGLVDLGEF